MKPYRPLLRMFALITALLLGFVSAANATDGAKTDNKSSDKTSLPTLAPAIVQMTTEGSYVRNTYDNLNRLIGVKYDNGTSIAYVYDANGNRLKETMVSADTLNKMAKDQFEATGISHQMIDRQIDLFAFKNKSLKPELTVGGQGRTFQELGYNGIAADAKFAKYWEFADVAAKEKEILKAGMIPVALVKDSPLPAKAASAASIAKSDARPAPTGSLP